MISLTDILGFKEEYGILEDNLHILSQCLQLLFIHAGNVLSLKENLSVGTFMQMKHRAPQSGFSAPGLSYYAKSSSSFHAKTDIIHGMQLPAGSLKILLQVLVLPVSVAIIYFTILCSQALQHDASSLSFRLLLSRPSGSASSQFGHRGANLQPVGSSVGSGINPGIGLRRSTSSFQIDQ